MDLNSDGNEKLAKLQAEQQQACKRESDIESLSNTTSDLEQTIRKHQKQLDDYEEEYKKYKRLIEKEKEELEKLQKSLAEQTDRLQELQSIPGRSVWEIEYEIRDEVQREATAKFLNRIYEVNSQNSYHYYLLKDDKTISVLDSYYLSEKEFLVLGCAEWPDRYDFVITKYRYDVDYYSPATTMTELKQNKGSRLDNLKKCVATAVRRHQETKERAIPFDKPCMLGGQRSSNRTGYGSEYHWGVLYREGTLYGETTDFLIIGIIFR